MRLTVTAMLLVFRATIAFAGSGPLVIVGGGDMGRDIISRTLAVAGGTSAIVAILPQASADPDAGDAAVKMWLAAGAREAVKVTLDDRGAATSALTRATLIWFPGGDQTRLIRALETAGVTDLIRGRHQGGTAVGGTSAGAAVMSELMITGEGMDLQAITAARTQVARGLALWPEVIVDQHFLKRQRGNRLISVVLDHPDRVGVGIDESTAVIVQGSSFEVIGRSSVVVLDARHAQVEKTAPGQPASGRSLTFAVLRAGQSYALK